MADDTNTAEREAAEQWLRDRYGAYRGHFAWRELEEAFLAGRASLAASAGSEPEPFGHWFTDDPKSFAMPGSGFLLGKEPPKDAINVIPVYTHPSPPEGMAGWKPTFDMRAVVAVAVTMLYETHPKDVCRVFDLRELEKIVNITELLGSQQVEDIYRSAWDHLAAPPLPASEAKEL